jgi:hypothetical protein
LLPRGVTGEIPEPERLNFQAQCDEILSAAGGISDTSAPSDARLTPRNLASGET